MLRPESVLGLESAEPGVSFELPPEYLQRAVSAAPFQSNREPPAERYSLPGDALPFELPTEMPQRELPPPPAFQVLGTASSPEGSLAIVRVETGTPQYLAVGDQMNGYRVESIDRGQVIMVNADRSLILAVASPSPLGPAAQQGRNTGQHVSANQIDAVHAMMEGLRVRMQGATPEQRAVMQQEVQAAAAQLGFRLSFASDQIVYRGPGQVPVISTPFRGGTSGVGPGEGQGRVRGGGDHQGQ